MVKLADRTPLAGMITVYLAYAQTAERQHYQAIHVKEGASLYEALAQAGWLTQFPELGDWCAQVADTLVPTAKRWHVGIYAQKQPLTYSLKAYDRIEVYRSLGADPMLRRQQKTRAKG